MLVSECLEEGGRTHPAMSLKKPRSSRMSQRFLCSPREMASARSSHRLAASSRFRIVFRWRVLDGSRVGDGWIWVQRRSAVSCRPEHLMLSVGAMARDGWQEIYRPNAWKFLSCEGMSEVLKSNLVKHIKGYQTEMYRMHLPSNVVSWSGESEDRRVGPLSSDNVQKFAAYRLSATRRSQLTRPHQEPPSHVQKAHVRSSSSGRTSQ